MKHIYLLIIGLIFAACSKEKTYSSYKLKEGQELELLVSNRYGAIDDKPLLMPQNSPIDLSLYYFYDREPGYAYRIKARMHVEKNPPQDGPAYYLEYIETLSKEKYEGNESFELELIQSYIPEGSQIILYKEQEKYLLWAKIQATYRDAEIEEELEEIWQHQKEIHQNYKDNIYTEPKWRSIRATVSHDPNNFGNAYLVQKLHFIDGQ